MPCGVRPMPGLRFFNFIRISIIIGVFIFPFPSNAQDSLWTQKLDGWIDGIYQPYLFAGGSYYTKVSFADIDGDGDYDMFVGGGGTGSFRLFENYGNQYEPMFRLKDLVHPGLVLDAKERTIDAEFGDVDGDRDLDIILTVGCNPGYSTASGVFINAGDSLNPIWELPSSQPGISSRGPTSLIDFDEDCDLDVISGMQDNEVRLCIRRDDTTFYFDLIEQHLGNIDIGSLYYLDVADLDADEDYDLVACVTGGINKYYENVGGPGIDSLEWVLADSNFLGGQYMPDWLECPELVDIDADGDLDLFLAGAFAHLNYFENVGDIHAPAFEHRYDTTYFYNFHTTVDEAQFVDIDADGDLDIATRTMLVRNVGPLHDPHWETEYGFFPDTWYREFCDIDADGDYDMLIPADAGVFQITNIGTPQEPAWDSGHYLLSDSRTAYLFSAIPVDIDADNDYDLILGGQRLPDLMFYENVGDSANAEFELGDDYYLGFDREGEQFDPVFADMDLDGDLDLLISAVINWSVRSKLVYYRNDGTAQNPVWNYVTDDYMGWFSSGLVNHAYLDCGDYDADGDPDILMSFSMGLLLFLNEAIPTGVVEEPGRLPDQSFLRVTTYPNPFNGSVTFKINLPNLSQAEITIYDILGRRVGWLPRVYRDQFTWDADDLPSGIYFYRLQAGSKSYSGRMVLLK